MDTAGVCKDYGPEEPNIKGLSASPLILTHEPPGYHSVRGTEQNLTDEKHGIPQVGAATQARMCACTSRVLHLCC